jgi:uncharacterized protein (UPF0128 family)
MIITIKKEFDTLELPETLYEFHKWIKNILKEIPEEQKKSATIELDRWTHGIDLVISYNRPETEEEINTRLTIEKQQLLGKTILEKQEYERLKKKFEK